MTLGGLPYNGNLPWPALLGGDEEGRLLVLVLPVDVSRGSQQHLDDLGVALHRRHVQRRVVEPVALIQQFVTALSKKEVVKSNHDVAKEISNFYRGRQKSAPQVARNW